MSDPRSAPQTAKRRIEVLQRRVEFLEKKLTQPVEEKVKSFLVAELSALRWAVKVCKLYGVQYFDTNYSEGLDG